jgi:hypothetical protein
MDTNNVIGEAHAIRISLQAKTMRRSPASRETKASMASMVTIGVVLALIPVLFFAMLAAPVAAYSDLGWTTATPCVGSGSVSAGYLFTSLGPSAEFWTITVTLGLDGGDDSQYANFYFWMVDNSNGKVVAEYGNAHYQWVAQGETNFYTLSAYASGTVKLEWQVDNPDSASQCFIIGALPIYPTYG